MAIVNVHIRFLWGAFDASAAETVTPSYVAPTQYASLGPDAAAAGAGIGVRRASLLFRRTTAVPADDDCMMHFDFLNITSGAPDDTWISADYASLESAITTFVTAIASSIHASCTLYRIAWHRVGPGIPKPNPAERILDLVSPINGAGAATPPPQMACSITFRTGVRRSWGRTYLPCGLALNSNSRLTSTQVDAIANACKTMFDTALSNDFHPVVVSTHLNSALGIDTVEVDDVIDIVRRRRWKHTGYRKIVAA